MQNSYGITDDERNKMTDLCVNQIKKKDFNHLFGKRKFVWDIFKYNIKSALYYALIAVLLVASIVFSFIGWFSHQNTLFPSRIVFIALGIICFIADIVIYWCGCDLDMHPKHVFIKYDDRVNNFIHDLTSGLIISGYSIDDFDDDKEAALEKIIKDNLLFSIYSGNAKQVKKIMQSQTKLAVLAKKLTENSFISQIDKDNLHELEDLYLSHLKDLEDKLKQVNNKKFNHILFIILNEHLTYLMPDSVYSNYENRLAQAIIETTQIHVEPDSIKTVYSFEKKASK